MCTIEHQGQYAQNQMYIQIICIERINENVCLMFVFLTDILNDGGWLCTTLQIIPHLFLVKYILLFNICEVTDNHYDTYH